MKRSALLLVLLLLVVACARQGYPTGGPKDTTPPQLLSTKPNNESRQFAEKEFYLQFDEYVVLKNADANVLVSPPMATKPEYTTKGKGVLVRIKDTLQPNTTYLFQFKEAIADYTEGNVLPSTEYVFSTGADMDTMMLAGKVENARNGKPWPEVLAVSAFRTGDTVPAFVTRTDKDGIFAFHYIPQGQYRLVAMEDKNSNWLPDSTEAVAWDTTLHSAIDSVDSAQVILLRVFAPDRRRQRVVRAEFTAAGRIEISTLLPMSRPRIEGIEATSRLNAKADTLTLWLKNEQADSARLVLVDEGIADTLTLRYRAPKSRGRQATPPAVPLMRALCDGNKAFYDSLMLSFNVPVHPISDSLVATFMRMKDSTLTTAPVVLDSSGLRARMLASIHSGEEYQVRLKAALFADLYDHPTDSLKFKLTAKDYGTLTLHITNRMPCPLVVEVLDSKDTVVRSHPMKGSGDVRFSHLPAGDYRLRAVLDADNNGQWTTGDYFQGRQPEEYILFDKTLQLREKWEMEEQWVVGRTPAQSPTRRISPPEGGAIFQRGQVGGIKLTNP